METNRKRALTPEEKAECEALNKLFLKRKREGYLLPNGERLTQSSLADGLEMSQGGLSHYLTAKNALGVEFAMKVAAALDISIGAFSRRLEAEARRLGQLADQIGDGGGASQTTPAAPAKQAPAPAAEADEILAMVQDLLRAGKLTRANLVLAMMNSTTAPAAAQPEQNGGSQLPQLKNTVSVEQLHNRQVIEDNKNQIIEDQQKFVGKLLKPPPKKKPAETEKKAR